MAEVARDDCYRGISRVVCGPVCGHVFAKGKKDRI